MKKVVLDMDENIGFLEGAEATLSSLARANRDVKDKLFDIIDEIREKIAEYENLQASGDVQDYVST